MKSSTFEVTGDAPHRSAVVTAMAKPNQVDFSPQAIGASALIAAGLLFLIAFPSELFNSTLERHYDEIRGWFRLPPKKLEATPRRHQGLLFAAFLLAGGVLYGMLYPSFGANRASVALALGLTAALGLITLAFDLPALAYHWRRNGHRGALMMLPGTLVIAAACVALSRAVDFLPGYFYGLIAGMVFGQQLSTRIKGRMVAVSALLVLLVSVGAWLWLIPVSQAADQPNAGLPILVLEAALGATFYIGLDSLVISLLPLRFLQGSELRAWSRTAWTVIFGLSLAAFVHILFRPNTGYVADTSSTSARLVVGLFIAFGIFSVLFWAYFRYRRPRGGIVARDEGLRQDVTVQA